LRTPPARRCHCSRSPTVVEAWRRGSATTHRLFGSRAACWIAAAIVIYQGWAENLQTRVPGYAQWVQDAVEGNSASKGRLDRLGGKTKTVFAPRGDQLASQLGKVPLKDYGRAPDVHDISAWINSPPLKLPDLRDKVVLVDFWTYSCINCLRTLPYLKAWDARYRSKGLVILGIHTPEFAFEHDPGNVRAAVKRLGIDYPVALDNHYGTWKAYSNNYWPADYLIDQAGRVRDVHFGEGDYAKTEQDIRLLLEAGNAGRLPQGVRHGPHAAGNQDARVIPRVPAHRQLHGLASENGPQATYRFPASLTQDSRIRGRWKVEGERIVAGDNARSA
jgi:thiol-disulfide isomerase/thioredoxin